MLGDSGLIIRIYEDGMDNSTRKTRNHAEFLIYGLKCQNTSNGYGEEMPMVY